MIQCLVSFLVLQSSCRGIESWLLCDLAVAFAVNVLCPFPAVPLDVLWSVIVSFYLLYGWEDVRYQNCLINNNKNRILGK